MRILILTLLGLNLVALKAGQINIKVTSNESPIEYAQVQVLGTTIGGVTDGHGQVSIKNLKEGMYSVGVSTLGFIDQTKVIELNTSYDVVHISFQLEEKRTSLDEVVVSGTMKEVTKLDSPVPVEVYSKSYFNANTTNNIFEAIQNINGVRPQLNCSICNTGDIHINGLEGPNTMVLIDGMPIVSGLSTVYGFNGIPQSLVERVEVVKGPAAAIYGSEAIGGVINIITKNNMTAPQFFANIFTTSWQEVNADLGTKIMVKDNVSSIVGLNYFNFQNPIDNNGDGFTDLTLQHRVSLFNKWNFMRKDYKRFTIAGRYVYEDRWGGELDWQAQHRGGTDVYGESIFTSRWEAYGIYDLPVKEQLSFQFSLNGHDQNSVYGDVLFNAKQYVGFGQLLWDKKLGVKWDKLTGLVFRYIYYDDDTFATLNEFATKNTPSRTHLPGVFTQLQYKVNAQNLALFGLRYDYNNIHGSIVTPRISYKINSKNKNHVLRFNIGNGFRVANIFTEDHAALTGARELVINEQLRPEQSWNVNMNFTTKKFLGKKSYLTTDATLFYTHFINKIIPDYETDVNKIIYDNLTGYSESKGVSMNFELNLRDKFKAIIGGTLQEVTIHEDEVSYNQLLTENFSMVWNISYDLGKTGWGVFYTGNAYSPMRLPLLSELDSRAPYSPWFSLQNIKIAKSFMGSYEIYGGVKNMLNFIPANNSIARSFDPFDKDVDFDAQGNALVTEQNPQGLTFDPTYVYASNQGIHFVLGFIWNLP